MKIAFCFDYWVWIFVYCWGSSRTWVDIIGVSWVWHFVWFLSFWEFPFQWGTYSTFVWCSFCTTFSQMPQDVFLQRYYCLVWVYSMDRCRLWEYLVRYWDTNNGSNNDRVCTQSIGTVMIISIYCYCSFYDYYCHFLHMGIRWTDSVLFFRTVHHHRQWYEQTLLTLIIDLFSQSQLARYYYCCCSEYNLLSMSLYCCYDLLVVWGCFLLKRMMMCFEVVGMACCILRV